MEDSMLGLQPAAHIIASPVRSSASADDQPVNDAKGPPLATAQCLSCPYLTMPQPDDCSRPFKIDRVLSLPQSSTCCPHRRRRRQVAHGGHSQWQ